MRAEFDSGKWDRFWNAWDSIIQRVPDARRLALHEMGKAALREVWAQIGQQGIQDSMGRVRRWQSCQVGSGGGYVRVSADGDVVQVTRSGEKTTARDVTRYLEHGHKIRDPSGRAARYTPQVNMDRLIYGVRNTVVRGRLFYSYAAVQAERIAVRAAERNVLVPLENMLDDLDEGG